MTGSPALAATVPLAAYALNLGDDSLVLAQRLSEWVARAPQLEEDVALGNLALDLLGQARSLLAYAAQIQGDGRTEDDLAFLRQERQFTNLQIVEHPNEDFAVTVARQLCFSTYQLLSYDALRSSSDPTLAAIAGKAVKEVAYHVDHATQWTLRLGDGTEESHRKMQAGLERVWPYTAEMFQPADPDLVSSGVAVDPPGLRAGWDARLAEVLAEATLEVPQTWTAPGGGRRGVHTEPFGYLLAEMQHLHRSYPGASW